MKVFLTNCLSNLFCCMLFLVQVCFICFMRALVSPFAPIHNFYFYIRLNEILVALCNPKNYSNGEFLIDWTLLLTGLVSFWSRAVAGLLCWLIEPCCWPVWSPIGQEPWQDYCTVLIYWTLLLTGRSPIGPEPWHDYCVDLLNPVVDWSGLLLVRSPGRTNVLSRPAVSSTLSTPTCLWCWASSIGRGQSIRRPLNDRRGNIDKRWIVDR